MLQHYLLGFLFLNLFFYQLLSLHLVSLQVILNNCMLHLTLKFNKIIEIFYLTFDYKKDFSYLN